MAKIREKTTTVREHPLHVPISEKNPSGITIRDQHQRRIKGTFLERDEINKIFKDYNKKGIVYPSKGRLDIKNSDKYDEIIAVWTDYFNKKFDSKPPIDANVVKALIASESDFREDPPGNPKATGIAQITPETLREIQHVLS